MTSFTTEFLPTGEGYRYRWGDHEDPDLISIYITDLRKRNGSLHCVATTYTSIPNARAMPDAYVLSSEVWLRSQRSRHEYGDALSRLVPVPPGAAPIDFAAIMEQVARLVIEHETSAFDVQHLNGNVSQQPTVYLLQGILPAHLPTILYGAGGVGKSIFAAAVAMAVQSGVRLLDCVTQQAEVLYLDWETDANDIGRRMHAAAAGLGVTNPSLRYISLQRPLEDQMSQLTKYVSDEHIGLVIIDSAGMAMKQTGREGDPAEGPIRFFGALRTLGCAVLVIDHISGEDMRRGKTGAGKPYGSVYKWNITRNAFELRQDREPDMHGSHLLLKHRKTNVGPRMRDTAIRLIWDDSRGMATFGLDINAPSPVPVPTPEQVIDILLVGRATPGHLTDLLNEGDLTYQEMDVRRVVRDLLLLGRVRVATDGSVGLADDTHNAVDSGLLDTTR